MRPIPACKLEIARWLIGLMDLPVPLMAEIGVKQGHLATRLLQNHSALTLYLIDRWLPSPADSEYVKSGDPAANADSKQFAAWQAETRDRLAEFRERAVIIRNESASAAAVCVHERLQFDLVYIDADHSYSGRLADLEAWTPLVKPGGWVAGGLWHSAYGGDCCKRAVSDYLRKREWNPFGRSFGPHATWAFKKPEAA